MSSYGDRLKEAREAKGYSQQHLAGLTGGVISQGQISKLESGLRERSTNTVLLAAVLDVQPRWLDSGRGPRSIHDNVEPARDPGGKVPLISYVRAGSWDPASDPLLPGEGEMVPCPVAILDGMYALRVRGESMFNPTGTRSYPDGCMIFVNPHRRSPINGERIIAKIAGEDEVTFKQFAQDGSRVFLKPLNPQWPIITDEFRVLGTVVAKVELE